MMPESYRLAAPLSEGELASLLLSSPLYQKIEGIKSMLSGGAGKGGTNFSPPGKAWNYSLFFLSFLRNTSNLRVIGGAYHLYEKPGNSGENSNGIVHPGGNFSGKKQYLSRYYLFRVFTETTEIFCNICLVNQCQASSWGGRSFVLTQAHSLSVVLQIVQL